MKKFVVKFQVLQSSGKIPSLCNAITFNNTSLIDTVLVNNMPLQPQQTLSIEGNEGEIDYTDYNVKLGTDPNTFYVITKFFV